MPYRPPVAVPDAPLSFFILAREHMGAAQLVHSLKRHRRVRCDSEPLAVSQSFAEFPLNWTLPEREQHRFSYLDRLLTEATWSPESTKMEKSRDLTRPPLATGFRTATVQLTRSEFTGLTASPTIRKVVLRRANPVDAYLDKLVEERTDGQTGPIEVIPRELLRYLISVDMETKCLDYAQKHSAERGSGQEWLFLDYDELIHPATQSAVLQRVFNHILPPPWHIVPNQIIAGHSLRGGKQPDTLRNETIANFEEVYQYIKEHKERPQFLDLLLQGLGEY
jgi:hypothetical protein